MLEVLLALTKCFLLASFIGDKNKSRRDAVRRKTAQYLMKAEDLYNRHLAKDTSDERRWVVSIKLIELKKKLDRNNQQYVITSLILNSLWANISVKKKNYSLFP